MGVRRVTEAGDLSEETGRIQSPWQSSSWETPVRLAHYGVGSSFHLLLWSFSLVFFNGPVHFALIMPEPDKACML